MVSLQVCASMLFLRFAVICGLSMAEEYSHKPHMDCDLLENGVNGIVSGLRERDKTCHLHLSEELCLPHVNITGHSWGQKTKTKFTVCSSSSFRYQKRVIRDLIQYFRWSKFGFMYDKSVGTNEVKDLIFTLSEIQTHVTLVNLNAFSSPESSPTLPTRMLFIGPARAFQELHNKKRASFFDYKTLWLVVTEDITQAEVAKMYAQQPRGGIVFVRRKWLKANKCQICRIPKSQQFYRNLTIYLDDDETHNSVIYEIHSVQNFFGHGGGFSSSSWATRGGKGPITKTGEWDSKTGLRLQQDTPFRSLWHYFGEAPIRVAAVETPPFTQKQTGNGTRYKGFSIDVLDELALKMGFRYTVTEPPDGQYGTPDADGTWNGMVGMVYRGEVEMAIGPITITSQREQVVDLTRPILEGRTGILLRSLGHAGGNDLFQTMKPFSTPVWLTICGLIVLVSLVSYIINCYTPYQPKHSTCRMAREIKSFKGNCWMVYASITEQGVETYPSSSSGRCILGFWWVFTILLVAAYTANLTAVLTVAIPPAPIGSLRELLSQDTIQPIVKKGSSFESLFQNSKSELYKQTWSRLRGSPKIAQQSEILEVVRARGYAYISDRPVLAYIAGRECESFSVAEESFGVVGYGIVIPEGAPYGDTMNRLIVKMQEAGLIDKWHRRWWTSDSSCKANPQTSQSRLGLDSLGGLFLVYLGTTALACICFLVEFVKRRVCFEVGHIDIVSCE